MLDNDDTTGDQTPEIATPASPRPDSDLAGDTPGETPPPAKKAAKKASKSPAKKAAKKATKAAASATAETATAETDGAETDAAAPDEAAPAEKPKKKAAAKKRAAAKKAAPAAATEDAEPGPADAEGVPTAPMVLFQAPETTAPAKKAPARKRAAKKVAPAATETTELGQTGETTETTENGETGEPTEAADAAPATTTTVTRRRRGGAAAAIDKADRTETATTRDADQGDSDEATERSTGTGEDSDEQDDSGEQGEGGNNRRRRRRGGRRRRKPSDGDSTGSAEGDDDSEDESDDADDSGESAQGDGSGAGSRRRRRRRRSGDDGPGGDGQDDPDRTVTRVRKPRNPEDEITSIGGSTRLEAKKQRRREGREAGRRRAPIVSEAEFLARRESVDRVMVIRQRDDLTQIGVLEDKVLVEHYVARESQTSLIGNVYLGRVQNVLPSMEAAFIDIGKGRNAVLYAGEVNWAAVGHKDGQPRKIESVLSSGQTLLVQVTKDPIGHKGARLSGQVSLPGRFLVYVPEGNTSGISRKLPDTERNRLKTLLKEIVPDTAGVIVRTAAEGASEAELTLDVERLTARWSDIEEKVKSGKGPQLLYGEPDLTLKVVRDLFTEDFAKLVIQGDDAWDLVDDYVSHVAPDLRDRLERFEPAEDGSGAQDLFATYRVDEQIAKGLDRKVWLPSGGSLVIDRTEAMTVVDVNTGKFTGSGGNLEETVTKNNLEAAEEIVRQLRLRDIGGIIVVDFIDMVLESNRDLVLRRLVECLGRDRTRHQVAEVTSLGLVQMTRKRIGTGLVEAFSTECEHCKGRGLVVHDHPVESGQHSEDDEPRGARRGRGGRNRRGAAPTGSEQGKGGNGGTGGNGSHAQHAPSPADLAGSRPPEKSEGDDPDEGEVAEAAGTPAGTAVDEPAEQPVATQVEAPADQPTETPDATVAPQSEPASESEPQPQPQSEPESAPETAAAPEVPVVDDAPRLVTTRRRSARRAAGPPVAVTEHVEMPGAGTQAGPDAEPVDVPVDPAAPGHAPDDSFATDLDDQSDEGAEAHEGDEGDEGDEGGAFSLLHVPIKRKGARRR